MEKVNADVIKILYFLEQLKSQRDIRIIYNNWSPSLGREFHVTNLEYNFEGGALESTGIAENKIQSIVIAAMELFERIAFYDYNLKSTNGLAAHFKKDKADENALKELVERDTYLYYYLTQNLPEADTRESELEQCILKAYPNTKISSFLLKNNYGFNVVQSIIWGEDYESPFGMIVGLGSDKSYEIAKEKSLREIMSTLGHDLIHSISFSEFFELEQRGELKLFHHHQLALSLDYAKKYKEMYVSEAEESLNEGKSDVLVKSLDVPEMLKTTFPLFISQAESKDVQQIFWGSTTEEKININRFNLSELSNLEKLKFFPHPFA